MARIRTIKPEFPQSESMGRVSREARLCFVLLWTILDDEGRARGSSRMLASLLYPYDDDAPKAIEGWLEELEREGCVTRYRIGSDSYIASTNWLKHQKIDKPSRSRIPAPSEGSRIVANVREASATYLGPRTMDQDLGPGPRTKDQSSLRSDVSAGADRPPPEPQPVSKPLPKPPPLTPAEAPVEREPEFALGEAAGRDLAARTEAVKARGRAGIQSAFEAYNATAAQCGWPIAQLLNPARGAQIARRLIECGGLDVWRKLMVRASESPFLRGEEGRAGGHENWRPTLDFFLQARSFTKLLEGGFDRKEPTASSVAATSPGSELKRIQAIEAEHRRKAAEAEQTQDGGHVH